jgi:hypothetical protein
MVVMEIVEMLLLLRIDVAAHLMVSIYSTMRLSHVLIVMMMVVVVMVHVARVAGRVLLIRVLVIDELWAADHGRLELTLIATAADHHIEIECDIKITMIDLESGLIR